MNGDQLTNERAAALLRLIGDQWTDDSAAADWAAAVHLTRFHFQRVFRATWARPPASCAGGCC